MGKELALVILARDVATITKDFREALNPAEPFQYEDLPVLELKFLKVSMARIIIYRLISFILICCQSRSKQETEADQSSDKNTLRPMNNINEEIGKFAYPIYVYTPKPVPVSGSFLNIDGEFYFLTAAHLFYDFTKNRMKDFEAVEVYNDPNNPSVPGIAIARKDLKVLVPCKGVLCADIAIFPINVPRRNNINYLDIPGSYHPADIIEGREIYIAGYPNDKLSIVKTKILKWNFMSTIFLSETASVHGASGAPVLAYSSVNGVPKILLLGVYGGRYIGDEYPNAGYVSSNELLIDLIDSIRTGHEPNK